MKLAEIHAFVAVAETGGMQGAARRLSLTQSAVSRLVQRLERELGVQLFDRDSKPLGLTPDGERALALCRRVLREAASLRAAFTRTAAPSGPLRLGIAHAVAFMLAGPPLLRVRACFADVTPRVSADWSPGLLRRIAGGQLDAAIVVTVGTGAEPPAPAARRLGAAAVTAVAARNAAIDRPASLAQLNDRGWVTHPEGCGYRAAIARALQDGGCAMNIVAETFGIDLQLSLVAAGAGIGLLPIGLLRGQKLAEQLQPIELPELRLQIELWSVRSRQVGQLAPAIAAFEAGVEDLLRCP